MLKILIPIDGSATSLEAVRHALRLTGAGLRARFVLANVQAAPSLYEIVTAPDAGSIGAVSSAAGEHLLAGAAALLRQAGLPFEQEIVVGDAARSLLDLIEREACDAVLIGAARTGALRSVLIGSVSQSLLHDSPVPVTVVHTPAADESPAAGLSGGRDDDVGDGSGGGGDGD